MSSSGIYIDYSRSVESWGVVGETPAFDRKGNIARIYGGGTLAGHQRLVETLRREGVDDFGGTDIADHAATD